MKFPLAGPAETPRNPTPPPQVMRADCALFPVADLQHLAWQLLRGDGLNLVGQPDGSPVTTNGSTHGLMLRSQWFRHSCSPLWLSESRKRWRLPHPSSCGTEIDSSSTSSNPGRGLWRHLRRSQRPATNRLCNIASMLLQPTCPDSRTQIKEHGVCGSQFWPLSPAPPPASPRISSSYVRVLGC